MANENDCNYCSKPIIIKLYKCLEVCPLRDLWGILMTIMTMAINFIPTFNYISVKDSCVFLGFVQSWCAGIYFYRDIIYLNNQYILNSSPYYFLWNVVNFFLPLTRGPGVLTVDYYSHFSLPRLIYGFLIPYEKKSCF